jgi:hypothetical protein
MKKVYDEVRRSSTENERESGKVRVSENEQQKHKMK